MAPPTTINETNPATMSSSKLVPLSSAINRVRREFSIDSLIFKMFAFMPEAIPLIACGTPLWSARTC